MSASSSQGSCTHPQTNKVICSVALIAPGADVVVTIVVTTPATPGATIANKAAVKASELDLNTKNNTATQKTQLT